MNEPPHQRSRVIAASPVYYGWVVVAAGTLGMIMTTPGQTVGVSVFLDPIIHELGLTRSTVSTLYLLGTLGGAITLPFVGRALDRFGPRVCVVVVSLLLALSCLYMGFVANAPSLLLGFLLLRALGQGALGLVSAHVVNLWFVRRRGLALGLTGVGLGLANAGFPILSQSLIEAFGWRVAYPLLGALVALTILPVGAWLYRDQPERYGLRPDGHARPNQDHAGSEERHLTLREARRTNAFWLLIAAGVLPAALGTALIFHHYSILGEHGIGRTTAALVFVPVAVVAATTNLLGGALLDRFSPRPLVVGSLVFLSLALLAPLLIRDATSAFAYGAMLGLMQGVQAAVAASAWGYYFGRRNLGSIRGLAITATVAATAVGPLWFALGKDFAGTYTGVLLISALLPLALAVAALFIPLPGQLRLPARS